MLFYISYTQMSFQWSFVIDDLPALRDLKTNEYFKTQTHTLEDTLTLWTIIPLSAT